MSAGPLMSLIGGLLCALGIVLYSLRTGEWVYLPGRNAAAMNAREFALVVCGIALVTAAHFAPSPH